MPPLTPAARASLDRMDDAAWEVILDETLRFAERAALKLHWATPTGYPEWEQVSDIVLAVIDDLHSPEPRNRWDPAKGGLRSFLKMAVWGDLRLAADSAENRRRVDLTDGRGEPALDLLPNSEPTPEETMVAGEKAGCLRTLVEKLRGELPERHVPVFDRWLRGMKPAEIAEELGLDVEEVYPMIKGIRRIARKTIGDDFRKLFDEEAA